MFGDQISVTRLRTSSKSWWRRNRLFGRYDLRRLLVFDRRMRSDHVEESALEEVYIDVLLHSRSITLRIQRTIIPVDYLEFGLDVSDKFHSRSNLSRGIGARCYRTVMRCIGSGQDQTDYSSVVGVIIRTGFGNILN